MTGRTPVARADLQVGDVVTWRRIRDGELVERTEEVVARGVVTDDYVRTETSGFFRRRYIAGSRVEVVSAYRPAPEPEPEVTVTPRSYGVREVTVRPLGPALAVEVAGDRQIGMIFVGTPGPWPYYASPPVGADGARRGSFHATRDEAVDALVAAYEARS